MKKLVPSVLESLQGGKRPSCSDGIGWTIGFAAAMVVGAVVTGGTSLALGALLAINGGAALAATNCANQ